RPGDGAQRPVTRPLEAREPVQKVLPAAAAIKNPVGDQLPIPYPILSASTWSIRRASGAAAGRGRRGVDRGRAGLGGGAARRKQLRSRAGWAARGRPGAGEPRRSYSGR